MPRSQSICSTPGCDHPAIARGLCSAHWAYWKNHRDSLPEPPLTRPPRVTICCAFCGKEFQVKHFQRETRRFCSHACQIAAPKPRKPIEDRFWPKVNKDGPIIRPDLGPCWVWTAGLNSTGYGIFGDTRIHSNVNAMRISWELANGAIPEGLLVCHKCDNPPCVRPDHLFLGTNADNHADMMAKGRFRKADDPHAVAMKALETKRRNGTLNIGERNSCSKLTDADVRAIRAALARGTRGATLARGYGVTNSTIYRIRDGSGWTHIH